MSVGGWVAVGLLLAGGLLLVLGARMVDARRYGRHS